MDFSVAYTAGIIDGEGSILLARRGGPAKFRYPVVSVSSTTREILEWLKSHWGGDISTHKIYRDRHKQSWAWKVQRDRAIDLLTLIGPVLLEPEKARRAKLIVGSYKDCTPRNGKYSPEMLEAKRAFEHEFFHPITT